MFDQLSNNVGVFLVIVLSAIFIQVLSVNVSIARGKFKIKTPATTGHEGFEKAFRAHLNMVENFVVFLPIYVVALLNSGIDVITKSLPSAIFLIGSTWLLSRIIGSLNYIKGWNYKLGIGMYILSFLCLVALLVIIFLGMGTITSAIIENGGKLRG